MSRLAIMVVILSLGLFASMVGTAFTAPPTISRPMGFVEETIQGANPETVDYSLCYDTASGEIIQNMMDTLVMFNAEHTDQYIPSVATSWTIMPLGAGVDSGIPISGLTFENPANQTGPNATYYYRYDFKIRQGIFFQPPYNYSLTGTDIAFSFQRTMIMDTEGGPQWMLQEPLLDNAAGDDTTYGGIADLTNMTQVAELGQLIRNSVQTNGTNVWFNLMFPSAYPPFMQILTQTWSAIESKQWIDNQVVTDPARAPYEWDGNWPNYTAWITYHNPPYDFRPLDNPTPIMYGSGPYIMTTLDYANGFWSGARNVNYFRGWPADFPVLSASGPAGWVDSIYVTWARAWADRLADLTSGAADFVAVPRQNLADVFKNSTSPYVPPNYPIDGVRDMQPLPTLQVNAFFFTFNINPATPFGPIGSPGVFNESLIPSDFFGNPTWGVNVRKAFAQAFDYNAYISTVFGSEASHPATAIVPGLSYNDPTVTGWSYDLAAANASLNLAGPDSNGKMLKDVGFKLTLAYQVFDSARQTAFNLLANAIQSLNPLYHVTVTSYFTLPLPVTISAHMFPMFIAGWLADYPDPHDFAEPFYHTGGYWAAGQAYSNPAMDALIDAGINTPDGSARASVYHNIQVMAVQDCPSFTLAQPVGRHFERDWVVDWYYNPIYSGLYFYNLWKWYYVPMSLLDISTNPPPATSSPSFYLPADTNYDGKVDIRDISLVAKAFGTQFVPPIDMRWNFRGDVNNDRKIDMKDISYIAKQFGKSSPVWPSPKSTINAPGTVTHGTPATFTEAVTAPSGYSIIVNSVDWGVSQWPGPLVQQQTGQSLNFTYTFPAAGIYYVVNDIVYTVNTPYGNVMTSICEATTVTVG